MVRGCDDIDWNMYIYGVCIRARSFVIELVGLCKKNRMEMKMEIVGWIGRQRRYIYTK